MHELISSSALHARSLGWGVVLCKENGKAAAFKDWQNRLMERSELNFWLTRYRCNYGLLMNVKSETAANVYATVVIDRDGDDAATTAWMNAHEIRSPMTVRTSKGTHYYFKLPETVEEVRTRIRHQGVKIDIKMTGYCVGPGSWIADTETRYEVRGKFLAPGALPWLPASVVTELNAKTTEIIGGMAQMNGMTTKNIAVIPTGDEERLLKYVEKIDPSVQGQNGSAACVKAMLKILALVDGDVARAWPLALHYNRTRCVPPWDEEAPGGPDSLRRKLVVAKEFRDRT